MTPEKIAAAAGIVLSLLFSYMPVLKDWYDALTPTPKRLLMLALLVVTTLGSLAWTCRADLSGCVAMNAETYLTALVGAILTNAGTFIVSPLSPQRRNVRKAANDRHMAQLPPSAFLQDGKVENRTNEPQSPDRPIQPR